MPTAHRIIFSLAAIALLSFCLSVAAVAKDIVKTTNSGEAAAVHFSGVQLKHWKESPIQERYAFLAGFVSMLEVERSWQGKNGLPITESTVSTWMRGLSGATIKGMDNALNKYIVDNPKKIDKPVVEVLGLVYVRPKLTKHEQRLAGDRYEKIKVNFVP